jgi:hypothetical protein
MAKKQKPKKKMGNEPTVTGGKNKKKKGGRK